MDKADKRLLGVLRDKGRLSWVKLAEAVNLSPSACQRRVEAMRKDGTIRRFTVDVDPVSVGLTIHAFIHIKVERQKTEIATTMRARIQSYPEVRAFYKLSGSVDYMLDIVVADIKALSDFIDDKLLALDGVVDASSSIVLEDLPTSFALI